MDISSDKSCMCRKIENHCEKPYISYASIALILCLPHQTAAADALYEAQKRIDPPVVYQDKFLTGIDFPLGAVGDCSPKVAQA